MRTKPILLLALVVVITLSCAHVCVAQPPSIPHAFYGGLNVYGPEHPSAIEVPRGTIVQAIVNEDVCGSITTTEAGKYGGPEALDPKLVVQGDIGDGTTIYFYVNGVKADQTWQFTSGDVTELNLTVNDVVAPTITNLMPANGSTVSTGTPAIGADYSDVLSGIDVASVTIRLGGSDVTDDATVTASGVSYVPTVALADGSYTVEVSVQDRVGNPATETWSFTVLVPPAPPAPATLTVDTTPVKASVYVDGSLWGTAPQTRELDAGTYTVSFGDVLGYLTPASESVTLAENETRTITGVYTEISPEIIENVSPTYEIPSITPEENATADVENTAITELTICVKNAVENVRVTVQQLTERPAGIEIAAPGISYKYLNIVAQNITDADIDVILINFSVERVWITAENIDPDTIALRKWVAGAWVSLPTAKVGEDDTYFYYFAESSGLSIFAVSGSVLAPAPAEFLLSDLVIEPMEVGPGENVEISVKVMNVGGTAGTCSVTLKINGTVVDTEDITLAVGATGTVTFEVTEEVAGTYAVGVDGSTGTFVVTAPPSMVVPLAVTGIVVVLLAGILIWLRKRRKEGEEEEEDST
ncbi:hypothetical protein ES706_01249 [subsurface metagenome]|nr:PGF-pre-PGF domain-containing protein [Hadesarchaea archaeon]